MTKKSEQSQPRLPILPSIKTLAKYGLTPEKFWFTSRRQGNVCGVCRKLPESRRLFIDHNHVKGWKKMSDTARASYVRGLLCYNCNYRFASRGMTAEKAQSLLDYLKAYATVSQ